MRAFWERALILELGLGVLALGLGWLFAISPTCSFTNQTAAANGVAVAWGGLWAVPMLLGVPILERLNWQPVVRIRDLLAEYFGAALKSMRWWQLGLLACAAGWGEELLFRGFLQQGLAQWLSPLGVWGAILIASVAFAALHWVTWLYGVLAFLASVYLGWLFETSGNLLVPITTHAVYDAFALAHVVRSVRQRRQNTETKKVARP